MRNKDADSSIRHQNETDHSGRSSNNRLTPRSRAGDRQKDGLVQRKQYQRHCHTKQLSAGWAVHGPGEKYYNYSRLVFFTRVVNETSTPVELSIKFSADSIPIPGSPDTFVKLFLPSDTMTLAKRSVFDYGVKHLKSLDNPTTFQRTIKPKEECLIYVVGIFYQTVATAQNQSRGGNRAELVLKGSQLFYNMLPQVNSIPCGEIHR